MFRVIQDHIGKPLGTDVFVCPALSVTVYGVDFRVWNSMTQSVRECSITPSTWSGDGVLGLVIKYDDLDFDSTPPSIHVLDIFPNSPSSKAGLQAFDDYLLGTPEVVFVGLEEFDDVILNAPPPIRIFVSCVGARCRLPLTGRCRSTTDVPARSAQSTWRPIANGAALAGTSPWRACHCMRSR